MEKSPENFEKSKTRKNNRHNSKNNIFYKKRNLRRKLYSRPHVYQIWRFYLDLCGHDCKKWVCLTFDCKLSQSDPIVMQLTLDMSCHLPNVYISFQIDISKHVEEKSGKPGRTDGQTDGHCHGIIRPFFKRAYKKTFPWVFPCVTCWWCWWYLPWCCGVGWRRWGTQLFFTGMTP